MHMFTPKMFEKRLIVVSAMVHYSNILSRIAIVTTGIYKYVNMYTT